MSDYELDEIEIVCDTKSADTGTKDNETTVIQSSPKRKVKKKKYAPKYKRW